ncbi:ComEA family DNA-binding protein [Shewanella donghaensis]|uniref:ComEA family DNA-binding protein n=1 Tax=Shewanella donghaensis TaxID=238836 RepID=UPI001D04529A|nr:helix-hairpin-helix domain-containing protein [Shewanella donghaensis]
MSNKAMKHPLLMGVILVGALSLMSINVNAATKEVKSTSQTTQVKKPAKNVVSKININKATVVELQALNGVGEAKAKAIVEYRKKNGKFKSVQQLTQVAGIGEKLVEKNTQVISL